MASLFSFSVLAALLLLNAGHIEPARFASCARCVCVALFMIGLLSAAYTACLLDSLVIGLPAPNEEAAM